MTLTTRRAFVIVSIMLTAVARTMYGPLHGQERPAPVEPIHFHHVHLNSVNPTAAAEYYPKAFAESARKMTFNGYEAVKTGNVYVL